MLVNPYSQKLTTFDGTRLLLETLGIVGTGVRDLTDPRRIWTIQSIYAPVPRRSLGGIRVKVVDQQDFVSFINQRDIEVLLGLARPGGWCSWSSRYYVAPEDKEWVGFCMDEEDLLDDLQEREMLMRAYNPGVLPYGLELIRRVHRDNTIDAEELWTMLYDADPESGLGPDIRAETLLQRWVRIEQRRVTWPLDT